MKQILPVLLSVTIAAASLARCTSSGQSSQARTSQPVSSATPEFIVDKIGVTYVRSPLNVPSIVKKEQGILTRTFEEYGLPVEYSNLTTDPEQTQAPASGDVQFLYAVGATSMILPASNGADIKVIGTYSRFPETFRMFTSKGSKIQSVADLKGEKIVSPESTILHELMVAYLATAGLTEKDVEFVSAGIPDAQAALVGGTIDCALLAGPTTYNMEKDGYKIVTARKDLIGATIVVAASQSFYNENLLLAKHFLEVQDQVASYMKEDSEEILEVTAKETELSIDAVKEMYPIYDFSTEVTDADITPIKKAEQFMKEDAMIESDVNFDQLILKVE